jgi:PilZ domain
MDLRRHQRFPAHFHSVFSGPTLSESVGTIVNLSEGGCCIHTDSQVYAGIHLTLLLRVPEEARRRFALKRRRCVGTVGEN